MIDQANKLRDLVKMKNGNETEKAYEIIRPEISTRIIAVSSGKGGVGKTNFVVNLAIQLRKQNKRVVIIDTDFGLANIEVLFGIIPKYSFADVFSGSKTIAEVMTEGPMGIKFISGGSGLREMGNVSQSQMAFIIENFTYIDSIADVLLIDTGAGISSSVVNFIRAANEAIIITTPEPTSVTDAYATIKTVSEKKDFIPDIKIVVNRVDDLKEGDEIFEKLSKVSDRFLKVKLQSIGSIPYDANLIKAVKKQQPVSTCYPNSISARAIENISLRLMDMSVKNDTRQDGVKSFIKRLANIFGN